MQLTFEKSPLWLVKLAVFLAYFNQRTETYEEYTLALVFAIHKSVFLAFAAPALMFSVKNRTRTSNFLVQSFFMLTLGAFLTFCVLTQCRHLAALFLLIHFDNHVVRVLDTTRFVIPLQSVAKSVFLFLLIATMLVFPLCVPRQPMDVSQISLAFALTCCGEVIGVFINCMDFTSQQVGLWYERLFSY
jgi:hypothetical protein